MPESDTIDIDHIVPPDLLELYEVLEYNGVIVPEAPKVAIRSVPGDLIITRAMWRARAPRGTTHLADPEGSTAHYEGPHMGEFSHESCYTKVRGIQAFHMDDPDRRWNDIAYTSIECPHNYIFVCRWWNVRTAANGTNDGNARSYAHCVLMGVNDPLTDGAKRGLKTVFEMARQTGAGPRNWVHSDWKATACPGGAVRDFVKGGMIIDPAPNPDPTPIPQPPQGDDDFVLPPAFGQGTADHHHTGIMQSALIWHARDIVAMQMGGYDKVENFVDGQFGPGTAAVLKAWQQRTQALAPTGVCDPATYRWLAGV